MATPEDIVVFFTTIEALYHIIDGLDEAVDCLTVRGVSWQNLRTLEEVNNKDEVNDKRKGISERRYHLRHYDSASETIIIIFGTPAHEFLHWDIYKMIVKDLPVHWMSSGRTTYACQDSDGQVSYAEADSSGFPWSATGSKSAPGSNHPWPSLVMLAGCSQSLHALRKVMNWWFITSEYDVKVVLLSKWDANRRQVIIERWEAVDQVPALRHLWTSSDVYSLGLRLPERPQTIQIIQQGEDLRDPLSFAVLGSDLVLNYELLMGEAPIAELGQRDIVVPWRYLQLMTSLCWPFFIREEIPGKVGIKGFAQTYLPGMT